MREILFRGKRKDNGEWLLGTGIVYVDEVTAVVSYCGHWEVYPVVPETIGQFTGLTDKNGKKIFEGDIVKATVIYNEYWRDSTRKETYFYEIKYHEEHCYFYLARERDNRLFDGNWRYGVTRLEVIGNIHDNPELLKEMG